jgi:peptidoglycan/xylan/chitin deacetylase (PgdA/CDA1 family)
MKLKTVSGALCRTLAVALVLLGGALPLAAAEVHVIIYHTFLGKENVETDFTYVQLREQIDSLRKSGFRFVSYREVESGQLTGNNNVLLCIDDGNHTLYRAYREILKPANIKPLLAIYPNIIGKRKYVLTWDQLKELSLDGCDIAAHGFFHLHVNDKLLKKNPRYFHDEIYKSKKTLEEKLGRKVTAFVYPSGEKCETAIEEIQKAGYRCAFTINWGTLIVPLEKNKSIYELPRYMLVQNNWKNIFALMEKKAGLAVAERVREPKKKVVPEEDRRRQKTEKKVKYRRQEMVSI